MNMNFLTSTMELTRTDPAHIGTAPLTSVQPGNSTSETKSTKKKSDFENFLLSAMDQMNAQQLESSKMSEKILTGEEDIDIHDVTTAMAKAHMSLSLAQTVIDRIISGWNELSTTR